MIEAAFGLVLLYFAIDYFIFRQQLKLRERRIEDLECRLEATQALNRALLGR